MKYLLKGIYNLLTTGKVKIVVKEVEIKREVLSPNALARLRKELEPPILTGTDTAHTAAFKLGIQRALTVLEKGYVG